MPVNDYPIFVTAKRKKIPLELYFSILILIGLIAVVLANQNPHINFYFALIIDLFFLASFVPLIVTVIMNHYKIDFKKGKFIGSLHLHKDHIASQGHKIPLHTIAQIHFKNDDFFNRYDRNKWIGPKISCGVGNLCLITLRDGKVITIHFFQSHEHELVKALAVLEHYRVQKILSEDNFRKINEGTI